MQDYVFYCVTKNDEYSKGYSYGVKRGSSVDHEHYFYSFLDIDTMAFSNLDIPVYWHDAMGIFADNGNLMVVNSAIEIEDLDKRMYLLYLPSNLSEYQIEALTAIAAELKGISKDIKIYGSEEEMFNFYLKDPNFDKDRLIEIYLAYQKSRKQVSKVKQKVMIP